ncbi:MAG: hypothetical protein JWN48_2789 [Myxococcaceae bacterium]|nr:hypothetical protein [Myxococcaceae bacterium]
MSAAGRPLLRGLRATVRTRGGPGPAAEGFVKGFVIREPEQEGYLREGVVRVRQVLERELVPYPIDQSAKGQALVAKAALQSAQSELERLGGLLLGGNSAWQTRDQQTPDLTHQVLLAWQPRQQVARVALQHGRKRRVCARDGKLEAVCFREQSVLGLTIANVDAELTAELARSVTVTKADLGGAEPVAAQPAGVEQQTGERGLEQRAWARVPRERVLEGQVIGAALEAQNQLVMEQGGVGAEALPGGREGRARSHGVAEHAVGGSCQQLRDPQPEQRVTTLNRRVAPDGKVHLVRDAGIGIIEQTKVERRRSRDGGPDFFGPSGSQDLLGEEDGCTHERGGSSRRGRRASCRSWTPLCRLGTTPAGARRDTLMRMRPNQIPLRRAIWAFPLALTLHNLEEALTLPDWSKTAGFLHPPVGRLEFGFAVSLVTLAGYLVTYAASRHGGRWLVLAAASWVLLLLNVLFPHLLGALLDHGYSPGVLTAVLLNVPVNTYLLRRALRERAVEVGPLLRWALLLTVLTPATLPGLFYLGRQLTAAGVTRASPE